MKAPLIFLPGMLVLPLVTACVNTGSVGTDSQTPRVDGMPQTRQDRIGVEMLVWHLRDSDTFDGVLANRTTPALSKIPTDQLASNALTITRIDESDLSVLLGELGGASSIMSTWCGQMVDWSDIRDVRLSQALIDIDKTSILFERGHLAIAARAWIEPTIDGARMRVELVPRFRSERPSQASILRSARPKVHTFDELATSTDLTPGEVLLLTCTALPPNTETPLEYDPDDDSSRDTPVPGTGKRAVRSIDLGHALFSVPLSVPGQSPERVIIVIVPRIPKILLPSNPTVVPTPELQTAEAAKLLE